MRKVGIVTSFSADAASRSPAYKRFTDTIRASAPDLNISFEWRSAEGKNDRYPQIVTDLVQQQVHAIFTGPAPAAVAAKQVTTTVPVVFMIVANPVTLGLVKSLEKPGGNITGIEDYLTELNVKRLELLKIVVPKMVRVGVLTNVSNWEPAKRAALRKEQDAQAQTIGVAMFYVELNAPSELDSATAAIIRSLRGST